MTHTDERSEGERPGICSTPEGGQVDGDAFHSRGILSTGGVLLLVELALCISIHYHTIWHQRVEGNDFAFAVADDLSIRIVPQKRWGMSVSRNTKELISGFGSSWSRWYSGRASAFSLLPSSL